MYSGNRTELFDIDAIFRIFPNASVCSRSEYPPTKKPGNRTDGSTAIAKRVKAPRAVSHACNSKVFDSRQLSLFDESIRGGI